MRVAPATIFGRAPSSARTMRVLRADDAARGGERYGRSHATAARPPPRRRAHRARAGGRAPAAARARRAHRRVVAERRGRPAAHAATRAAPPACARGRVLLQRDGSADLDPRRGSVRGRAAVLRLPCRGRGDVLLARRPRSGPRGAGRRGARPRRAVDERHRQRSPGRHELPVLRRADRRDALAHRLQQPGSGAAARAARAGGVAARARRRRRGASADRARAARRRRALGRWDGRAGPGRAADARPRPRARPRGARSDRADGPQRARRDAPLARHPAPP